MMSAMGNNLIGFEVDKGDKGMSESMWSDFNNKFEQLAIRIENQLESKVETSLTKKMYDLSATLGSMQNTMSNLEKRLEPSDKYGQESPEEKIVALIGV
jgi:hypothetical protein